MLYTAASHTCVSRLAVCALQCSPMSTSVCTFKPRLALYVCFFMCRVLAGLPETAQPRRCSNLEHLFRKRPDIVGHESEGELGPRPRGNDLHSQHGARQQPSGQTQQIALAIMYGTVAVQCS